MPLFDFFRNLFGKHSDSSENYRTARQNNFYNEDYGNRVWEDSQRQYEEDRRSNSSHDGMGFSFNIYADPLEMQRYFEHQMNEVMKSFSGFFGDSVPFLGDSGSFFGFNNSPSLMPPMQPDVPQVEPPTGSLRDQFLKPGYQQPRLDRSQTDNDLDGSFDIGDIGSILKDRPRQEMKPYEPHISPQIRTFGQSLTSRTVQQPDGSIEIHRTVRDHDGNEETTVTRQFGDKQYSVTTRRDKYGKEEKIEDLVNMDEKDLSKFVSRWEKQKSSKKDDINNWFPFDKYFK